MRPQQDRVRLLRQPLTRTQSTPRRKRCRTWKSSDPCTAWLSRVPGVVTISVRVMVMGNQKAIPIPVVIINRNRKKTIIIDIPVSAAVKTAAAEMGIEAAMWRSLLRPPKLSDPHPKRWAAVEWCSSETLWWYTPSLKKYFQVLYSFLSWRKVTKMRLEKAKSLKHHNQKLKIWMSYQF